MQTIQQGNAKSGANTGLYPCCAGTLQNFLKGLTLL